MTILIRQLVKDAYPNKAEQIRRLEAQNTNLRKALQQIRDYAAVYDMEIEEWNLDEVVAMADVALNEKGYE